MNSGSSAFIGSAGHSSVTRSAASWYQTSRPGSMLTLPPVRRTTITWSTPPPRRSMAASTLAFSGTLRPPRRPSSAVMMQRLSQSEIRPARLSGEKPPNTTEWMAPSRAHASMAKAASGIMGM